MSSRNRFYDLLGEARHALYRQLSVPPERTQSPSMFPVEDIYKATLHRLKGDRQTRDFTRFTDAMLWLAGELEAGDGHAVYGEVRLRGELVWRRGRRAGVV